MAVSDRPGVAAPAPPPGPRSSAPLPLLILETMRPKQWTKNAFVFAGLIFAGETTNVASVLATSVTFMAFCLLSGATYLLNDASDVEADRRNPRTAGRAVARGDLSPGAAVVAAGAIGLLGLALAALVAWQVVLACGAYLALQLAYSNGLKHVLFIDVMVISAGFVLRALAGTLAVDAVLSQWLLMCTGLLALFLGLAKRRGEAVALGGGMTPRRPVLDYYSVALLDELIAVVTPAILVVYVLYAALGSRTDWMLLTVPFVLYGIFRALFLVHHRPTAVEDPSVAVVRDRPLLLCVAAWGVAAALVVLLAG